MKRFTLLATAAAALALVVGCGSGDDQVSSGRSVASSDLAVGSTVQPTGPSDPGSNLEQLLARSTPELVGVSVSCPSSERPHRYPFSCSLTAEERSSAEPVSGQVKVIGIYRPTRTYAFEVTYGPDESAGG
jgi:hypothetical protein